MPQMVLIPVRLDRNTAEDKIDSTNTARVLQAIDPLFAPGRLRRAAGLKRTQGQASAGTVMGCGVFVQRDCGRVVMYSNAVGDIYAQPGDGSADCAGPLDDWAGHGQPAT